MQRGVIVAMAVAVLGGLFGVASAQGTTEARSIEIRLTSINISSREVDKLPNGPSVGDQFLQTNRLRNRVAQFGKPAGAVVGRDRATLTLVAPSGIRVEGVVYLPGGTLTLRGLLRVVSKTTVSAAVVGGTGRFAGARGTSLVSDEGARRALNVYRLTLR